MKNKNAGFFIRFLSLIIDLTIFILIGISSSLMCIREVYDEHFGSLYQVKIEWAYYLWLFLLITILIVQFILIPFWFKGKTIGMILTKLELVSLDEESIKYKIFKKTQVGVFMWILTIILFMVFVKIETINKINFYSFIQKKRNIFDKLDIETKNAVIKKYKLGTWETVFITIPSTISSITIFGQLFALLSIGISKNKIGILDKFSNTKIVYKNKTVDVKNNQLYHVKPEKFEEQKINWRN